MRGIQSCTFGHYLLRLGYCKFVSRDGHVEYRRHNVLALRVRLLGDTCRPVQQHTQGQGRNTRHARALCCIYLTAPRRILRCLRRRRYIAHIGHCHETQSYLQIPIQSVFILYIYICAAALFPHVLYREAVAKPEEGTTEAIWDHEKCAAEDRSHLLSCYCGDCIHHLPAVEPDQAGVARGLLGRGAGLWVVLLLLRQLVEPRRQLQLRL